MSEQENRPAARRPKLRVAAERRDYDETFALDPRKPEDKALLLQRLREHPDPEVRYVAAAMLREEPVLAEIAIGDPDPRVRRAAILHLADADLWVLNPILAREPDAHVALLALACVRAGTIWGEALLARTALTHAVAELRQEALMCKRWDKEALAIQMLAREQDHDTAGKALREVRDRKALQRFADSLPTPALRALALRRIALLDEIKKRDGKPPKDKT